MRTNTAVQSHSAFALLGRSRRLSGWGRQQLIWFYVLISPWIIGFLLFTLGPMVASVIFSLTEWDLLTPPRWIGLANFAEMVADPLFWNALRVTALYALGSVSLNIVVAMLVAILLNRNIRGQQFFRVIYYLPFVVSGVAVAWIWRIMYHPEFGMINLILEFFGIQGPRWLSSSAWALPALILMSVWGFGGNMVIFLAGLQGIPNHLYEAAEIDGANSIAKFWYITLPLMTPAIFFALTTGIISALQAFTTVYVMTSGGPGNSTMVYGLYLYNNAFKFFKMGYASALAWVLFILILVATVLQFRLAKRWVFYEAEA
ncbi:MAG: sugar ABC transporter permease [Candidatus Roseilinea sp.]|nr:MAG: sugar ABC transporter permease [Candidatus Roseilinea sp.]